MEKGSEELLLKAAHEGRLDDVKRGLEDVKRDHVDVDCVDDRRCTPLFLAAEAGHEDVGQYLIDQGAYVNARDKEEKTPLLLAAQNGHDKIVQLLTEYGAALNPADIHNKTALALAAQNGHEHVVELLANAGVFSMANKQDKSGVKVEDILEWFVAPNEVQFDPNSSLARGSYGRVCPGIWNGVKVAVKSLLMGNENDHEVFLNEAEIWSELKRPHVMTMCGACPFGNPSFFVNWPQKGRFWIICRMMRRVLRHGPCFIKRPWGFTISTHNIKWCDLAIDAPPEFLACTHSLSHRVPFSTFFFEAHRGCGHSGQVAPPDDPVARNAYSRSTTRNRPNEREAARAM